MDSVSLKVVISDLEPKNVDKMGYDEEEEE